MSGLIVQGVKSRIVKEKDDIVEVLLNSLKKQKNKLKNKDILVVASKVIAVTQGRVVDCKSSDYKKGDLKKIIESEGGKLFPTNYCWLTYKENHLIPNAGVDKSNVPKGQVVLWPKNSVKVAKELQEKLRKECKLKQLGIIIADSTCAPMRPGVHGISIGHYGFEAIDDCRNKKDLYGNKIHVTRRAMADSLATTALIVMGETNERVPFAVISGAPVKFKNKTDRKQSIALKSDLFYGIYNNAFKKFLSK